MEEGVDRGVHFERGRCRKRWTLNPRPVPAGSNNFHQIPSTSATFLKVVDVGFNINSYTISSMSIGSGQSCFLLLPTSGGHSELRCWGMHPPPPPILAGGLPSEVRALGLTLLELKGSCRGARHSLDSLRP